jgi:four helix bundle protein
LNFGEAQGSNTKKDNINKLALTLKELNEFRVNLRILDKVNYGESSKRKQLLDEVEQLIKIIATIIKNKQS